MSAEPDAWPQGVARHVLDTVDSTNAYALRLAPGLSGAAWFLGLTQTAGKGRRARAWSSPRGNFHASLLLHPKGSAAEVALRSFVSALAVRDALAAVVGDEAGLRLKWPNDVLLAGGKVAGILLESHAAPKGGVAHLAIGIGVNLIAAPDPALIEAGATPAVTVLDVTGKRVEPERFLDALAPAFARWEAMFQAQGFSPVRQAWLSSAARLGEPIVARTGTTTQTGIFETLDSSGALVLGTPQGPLTIPAAEVFFP